MPRPGDTAVDDTAPESPRRSRAAVPAGGARPRDRAYPRAMALDPRHPDSDYLAFWREHHLCTLSIPRPDGPPHVTPVGVTYDPDAGLARVITSSFRTKVRHIRAGGERGVPVAVCQVDRGRWATLEGVARIDEDPAAVADAVRRYAERYGRTPRPNPDRVVIEIALTRALGRGTPPQPRAASGS